MNSVISLNECLKIINTKDKAGNSYPFAIDVWTLNKFSKTGGDLRRFKNVKLLAPKKGSNGLVSKTKAASTFSKSKRNPNHHSNRTRNIEFENGNIKTIHIRLIDSINGKKVIP